MKIDNVQHPGATIRAEILEPRGLSVTAGADALGVGRPALSNLLNGNADLSPDMALRLEDAWGVSADALLAQQTAYDLAVARARRRRKAVRR